MELIDTFKSAKAASRSLALVSEELRNEILLAVAEAVSAN
jgi:gamma-glutamyl phosphate reductase